MSPGTSSFAEILLPSRITVTCSDRISFNASSVFSALFSCQTPHNAIHDQYQKHHQWLDKCCDLHLSAYLPIIPCQYKGNHCRHQQNPD
ncbi:UNVERIFIED_CONTAM: hypothetical protein Sradi_6198000 [Sesamum radiatum]|uniref:Uncharacterized protein n=1 Tax=Sesamum radiatum TaxID=300843 RepID=A0AAW2K8X9_SESRA